MYPNSGLAYARNRSLRPASLAWSRSLMLVLSLLTLACDSGSGQKKSLAAYGIDDGADLGESTSMLVTPEEEAVITLKTGAQVKIDAGSLDKELTVTLERPADKQALALVKSLDKKQKLSSAPYVVTPHGTRFEKDVEVTLPVAKDRKAQSLKVMWLEDEDDKEWKSLGKPQVSEGKARIKVKHFSVLVLVEEGAAPVDLGSTGDEQSARALARLTACGLIAKQGDFAALNLTTVEEKCAFDCQLALPCETLELLTCGPGTDDASTPDLSAAETCVQKCGEPFTCADATEVPFLYRCDGEPDCLDGEDERDCPEDALFSCTDGASVPASFACDGFSDCSDESDEDLTLCEGKLFTCDNGETVGFNSVCDLYPDCSDGTDEPERCAKAICEPADVTAGQ